MDQNAASFRGMPDTKALDVYKRQEYELTYSAALELKGGEEESLPEIRKHIASLKEEIKKLGNVNVNAIEDYKEVSERYVFMKDVYKRQGQSGPFIPVIWGGLTEIQRSWVI